MTSQTVATEIWQLSFLNNNFIFWNMNMKLRQVGSIFYAHGKNVKVGISSP